MRPPCPYESIHDAHYYGEGWWYCPGKDELDLLLEIPESFDSEPEQEDSGSHDDVNHPSHYAQYPVEVIEITERLNFLMGNVVKYVLRADHKGGPIKDLKKAQWYLAREIRNRENGESV